MSPMMLVLPAPLFLAFLVMAFLVGYVFSFPPRPKITLAPIQTLETDQRTDGIDPQICETCYQAGKRASAEEVEKLAGKLRRREELIDRLRGSIAESEANTAAMSTRFGELGDEHAKEIAALKADLKRRDKGLSNIADSALKLNMEVAACNRMIDGLKVEGEWQNGVVAQLQADNHKLIADWKSDVDGVCGKLAERTKEVERLTTDLAEREKTIKVLQGFLAVKQDGLKEHAARLQCWANDQVKAAHNEVFNEGYRAGYGKVMACVLGAIENLPGPDALG